MSGPVQKTPTITDMFEGLDELPFRRHAGALRNRVNDLNHRLSTGAYYDQFPGKSVPWVFSKWYGPISPQVPRNVGVAGADAFAPLVTPARFVLPRGTNVLTGRDAAFYWCSTNVATYVNWTYAPGAAPFFPGAPVAAGPNGDIFDAAIEMNGGAQMCMDNTNAFTRGAVPGSALRVCFELDLYDRKRGRSLTDGRIPSEVIMGQMMENKSTIWPLRFDVDTEIEPRIYITEVNGFIQGDAVAYPHNQVTVFINLAFFGYNQLEEKQVP